MNWKDINSVERKLDETIVNVPSNWLLLHYYEALNVLFRVENALRMFVYVVLKDKKKGQWPSLSITSDDGSQTTISAIAKRRISQDESFGYLGYPITSPLMHLTSGELIRIILSDSYWPLFKAYFPASKDLVRTKLEEIGNVRNALAHFRPIKLDDVQVVKQNANQVLSRVESSLENLLGSSHTVPTNSQEVWYNELKVLTGQYCSIAFKQSEDENWVQIALSYSCPILRPASGEHYRSYTVLSINSPKVLSASANILDNVIFVSEVIPHISIQGESHPKFRKAVHLLFSRETLSAKHVNFRQEFEYILQTITNETDLIREDNLARGEFVQSVTVSASQDDESKRWKVDMDNLRSPLKNDDPPEFWGGKPGWAGNFITNTKSYPWMPTDISYITWF
jgi:hypothetical protein